MSIGDTIKTARENLALTQEDLAEKLEVSRQAVSKWELGASIPSSENLKILEEVLAVRFSVEEVAIPREASKAPVYWKIAALALGGLLLAALLSIGIYLAIKPKDNVDVPRLRDPIITNVAFFDENAVPLYPDLGDGWNSFTAGERVLIVVEFTDGAENSVNAVSLFLTPTGTETLDQRKQIAVQAAGEGRDFALFAWDIPQEGLMGHLEVILECGNFQVSEMLNVTASPSQESPLPEPETLTIPIGATLFMDEPYPLPLGTSGAPEEEIAWTSSNPAVVEVSDIGALFPVSPGTAVVTAEWNGQTAECQVEVFRETVPTDVPGVSKVVQ